MAATYSDWVTISGTTSEAPAKDDEPKDLRIKGTTHTSQTLGWQKSDEGLEDAYEVRYKKSDDAEFSQPIETEWIEHTINGLEPATKYDYQVRSVKKQ